MPKNRGGRPSLFDERFVRIAHKLALVGCTAKEMADAFGIGERTLRDWRKMYRDFDQAIRTGGVLADAEVAHSMFKRACGFEHEQQKTMNGPDGPQVVKYMEYYPPDPYIGMRWLATRQPAWRELKDAAKLTVKLGELSKSGAKAPTDEEARRAYEDLFADATPSPTNLARLN